MTRKTKIVCVIQGVCISLVAITLMSLIAITTMLAMSGCTAVEDEKTGKTTWKLNPLISKQVEDAAEGTAGILKILGPYIPYAGTGSVAIMTALGIYLKKIKPNYTKAKTEANLYHTTTHTLVQVVEHIKKNEPEIWAKLKPLLDSEMGRNTENAIRGLRGLPAKE